MRKVSRPAKKTRSLLDKGGLSKVMLRKAKALTQRHFSTKLHVAEKVKGALTSSPKGLSDQEKIRRSKRQASNSSGRAVLLAQRDREKRLGGNEISDHGKTRSPQGLLALGSALWKIDRNQVRTAAKKSGSTCRGEGS